MGVRDWLDGKQLGPALGCPGGSCRELDRLVHRCHPVKQAARAKPVRVTVVDCVASYSVTSPATPVFSRIAGAVSELARLFEGALVVLGLWPSPSGLMQRRHTDQGWRARSVVKSQLVARLKNLAVLLARERRIAYQP
jgi:hypothetical protein